MRSLRNAAVACLALAVTALVIAATFLAPARAQFADPIQILQVLETFYGTGVNGSASRINASSGNVAAATATATLPAIATKTNYLTQVDINGGGATAGSIINCTVTGLVGGTATYPFAVIAGVTLNNSLSIKPPAPIPASAVNVPIVASCPTFGAGNTNAAVNAYGFAQ
jgi:hypothetical protein